VEWKITAAVTYLQVQNSALYYLFLALAMLRNFTENFAVGKTRISRLRYCWLHHDQFSHFDTERERQNWYNSTALCITVLCWHATMILVRNHNKQTRRVSIVTLSKLFAISSGTVASPSSGSFFCRRKSETSINQKSMELIKISIYKCQSKWIVGICQFILSYFCSVSLYYKYEQHLHL